MNTALLPGMTFSMFCGCVMILGGSTAERKEEVEGKGWGERGGDGINMRLA